MARGYVSPIRLGVGELPSGFVRQDFVDGEGTVPAWRGGEGSTVFLCVHGYGGRPGSWTPLARVLESYGEVVMIATMGQTVSFVREVGFGLGESYEVERVASALVAEGKRVVGIGVSMGGAAVWLAAGRRPDLFAGVVTEASFARLDWATRDFLGVSIPAGADLFHLIVWFAERRKKVRGSEILPVEGARSFGGRGAIVHSRTDAMFGARHPEAMAEALGVEVCWFEGSKHADVSIDRPREFAGVVLEVAGIA